MASSYDISLGNTTLEILKSKDSFASIQIISTSTLNNTVTVNLKHSSNDANYEDLANTTKTIASGENSVLIETTDYTLDGLYLDIDVGSATVGELNWFISSKKKDSESVSATITGDVNVASTSESLANQDKIISNTQLLNKMLKKLESIDKTLIKMYR